MPVIKSAKKKQRIDKKRQIINKSAKMDLKALLKTARKEKTAKSIIAAIKAADKAAKKRIIHRNKAARIKSSLSKLLPRTDTKVKPATEKTVTQKTAPKAATPAKKKASKKSAKK